MVNYFIKRVIRSIVTLFIIISIVFILLRMMPVEGYFQNYEKLTKTQIKSGLSNMGLDKPVLVQLILFLKNLLRGNLGISHIYRSNVPITTILATKIPISFKLGTISLFCSMIIGIPLGIGMANAKGRCFDKLGTSFIVLIQAIPAAIYYLLIQLYGTQWFKLHILYEEGDYKSLVLPIVSLSLGNIAYYAMWVRRYMVDESNKEYVQLAKMKGISKRNIMIKHVFPNAFVPLMQYIPSSFLNTLIGSIYIESLYSIPGMGGLLVDVIKRQDNTMVQALVILYASIGMIGFLIGDVLMSLFDPRINL